MHHVVFIFLMFLLILLGFQVPVFLFPCIVLALLLSLAWVVEEVKRTPNTSSGRVTRGF